MLKGKPEIVNVTGQEFIPQEKIMVMGDFRSSRMSLCQALMFWAFSIPMN